MDPLSALGVAGNVVQFVQFTFELLNSSKKIYGSASGLSANCESLDTIYTRLSTFSIQLAESNLLIANIASRHSSELQEVAELCKDDCERLLHLVDKLRLKSNASQRWWQSFSKVILEIWTNKELGQLQERTSRTRDLVILKLCTISCECTIASSTDLQQLKSDTKQAWLDRAQQSKDLIHSFDELGSKIERVRLAVIDLATRSVRRNLNEPELALLTEQVKILTLSKKEFTKQNTILKSLDYDKRPVRHDNIPKAFENTFRWIFDDSSLEEQNTPGKRFVNWLKGEHDLFWISGKPGSGKSTLMKYIEDSEMTRSFLQHWAGSRQLVIASHYFWSAGSLMQRSREGLIRSLLFDIFMQIPEIISRIFKDTWKELDVAGLPIDWNKSQLETAMLRLAQIDALPARVCLFIDGLDEFEGDQLELSRVLLNMSTSRDIKICLSSRPWNVFEDSFGINSMQKLYLHELTRDDILRFAERRLYDHPRWAASTIDQDLLTRLVIEITNRAQGVFLWVFLVTQQLREGLTNYDSYPDLMKRLQSLPTDLNVFFKHILSSVEPFYHEKMACTLSIAATAKEPLPTYIYSFHEISHIDPDFALKLPVTKMTCQSMQEFENTASRRLNGWCKGLVERRDDHIEFIHRTVRDFLRTGEMTIFLQEKTPPMFNASLSILQSYYAAVKQIPSEYGTYENINHNLFLTKVWRKVFRWAGVIEHEDTYFRNECERLLDSIEEVSIQLFPPSASLATHHLHLSVKTWFREQVIRSALVDYVSKKVTQDTNYFTDLHRAPLSIAIATQESDRNEDCLFSSRSSLLLKFLLAQGNDPNEMLDNPLSDATSTPWIEFLCGVLICTCRLTHECTTFNIEEGRWAHALEHNLFAAFLDHNADVNAAFPCTFCGRPFWTIWLHSGFRTVAPNTQSQVIDHYLRDLRKVLSLAIDFNQMNGPSGYSITRWRTLCSSLASMRCVGTQQGFWVKIIFMLIEYVPEHILCWDDLLPTLKKILRFDFFSQILQALGKPVELVRPMIRQRARGLSDEYSEDVASFKKARMA